jgi:hypothetical protein
LLLSRRATRRKRRQRLSRLGKVADPRLQRPATVGRRRGFRIHRKEIDAMRRLLTASLALAAFGLCSVSACLAQEKLAAPVKVEVQGEHCAAPCLEKVCVPVPTKIKISKVQYKCKESDICLPRCTLGGHGHGDRCGRCGLGHGHGGSDEIQCPPEESCAKCGHPRTVRVLMKRTVTKECPSIKCEVKEQPAQPHCTTRRCATNACTETHYAMPAGIPAGIPAAGAIPRGAPEPIAAPLPRLGAPTRLVEPVR